MTLALAGATVRRGGRTLLDAVSLSVVPGAITAVLGPNGAGKSTALRALAGELVVDGGTVTLNGRPLAAWRSREIAVRRAVLPQSSSLDFPFTAEEVVQLGRMPHGGTATRRDDGRVVETVMRLADVDHLVGRRYTALSGGERQRVQLARALAQVWEPPADGSPRYLLLDEPTSNLDLAHQHKTLALARRFAGAGGGVLVVLHDLHLASLADQAVLLDGGRVFAAGPPDAVLTRHAVAAVFRVETLSVADPRTGRRFLVASAAVGA